MTPEFFLIKGFHQWIKSKQVELLHVKFAVITYAIILVFFFFFLVRSCLQCPHQLKVKFVMPCCYSSEHCCQCLLATCQVPTWNVIMCSDLNCNIFCSTWQKVSICGDSFSLTVEAVMYQKLHSLFFQYWWQISIKVVIWVPLLN